MAKSKKRSNHSEDRELEIAFRQMTGKQANTDKANTKNKGAAAVICFAVAAILVCVGALFFYMVQTEMNRVIVGNVSIAGVQLQGLTQAEAVAAVNQRYKTQNLTVTVFDHSVQLPSDCVKALNTRKAVRAACNSEITTEYAMDLTPYLDFDEEKIRSLLSQFTQHYNTTLEESSYQVLGNKPDQILQIHLGTPEYGLDLEQLYLDVQSAFGKNLQKIESECSLMLPQPIDLEAIQNKYCTPAVDATYDLKTHQIIGGEDGYGFDVNTVKAALEAGSYGEVLEFPFANLKPQVTRENVTETLFQDVLGTFTAKSSSQSNRDTNLRLACESINGIVLYPGDSFSYNETLGERTPEKGYRPAGTYVGNQTVNTYGGGICQVSSSLYYSVLCAELEVIERTNHGFLPSYMPRGLDATVNWGTLDFRFKNNHDYPIRIEAQATGGKTTVTIYGTETRNYRVELDATIIEKTRYSTEYRVMEANNKEGYKDGDTIVSPYTGYYVKSYIYKYEIETNKLISKDYIDDSNYRVRNAVICKIESATDNETKPEDTTPENSDSRTTPDTNSQLP